MHRSGTSLIANVLNEFGVYLGEPNQLLPGDKGNSLGHFENTAVLGINRTIFNLASGRDLDPLGVKALIHANELKKLHEQAELYISKAKNKTKVLGIKDPRIIITLDFWQRHLINPMYIIIFRNPYEVALSLLERDKIPLKDGLELWYQYNNEIVKLINNESAFLIDYNYMITNPRKIIVNLLKFIGISATKRNRERAVLSVIPTLRHQISTKDIKGLPLRTQETYLKLSVAFRNSKKSWISTEERRIQDVPYNFT